MAQEKPKRPLVLGLTGPIGSGVTTVSQILSGNNFFRISLSEPIKAELRKREKLDPDQQINTVMDWRKKLQDIGDEGRDEKRGGSLSHWLTVMLKTAPEDKDIVIDGIRNLGEARELRERFPRSFLIAVVAGKSVRWERAKPSYQQNELLFERDDKRDSEDKDDLPYGQQVERCVLEADYVFLNEEQVVAAEDQRNKVLGEALWNPIELMRGTKVENPKAEEVHMAQAYTLSHGSRCLKRHVGAVIVDRKGLPLSSGFNENPVGMKPCMFEFNNSCHKDNLMHLSLERLHNFFCPVCGEKIGKLKTPWKCPKCDEDLKRRFYPSRNMELCTAIHAEERAIRSLAGRGADGATMYVTTFPCFQCARYIVDSGIRKVVYVEPYPVKEALDYLERNKVNVVAFSGFTARAFNIIFRQVG